MPSFLKIIPAATMLGLGLLWSPAPARAQDYAPVEAVDLKGSPQRFWARGIVFRDTLKEAPDGRTLRLDDQTYHRFFTETLGEVYADPSLVERIAGLARGNAYLFSGTVAQRGRTYVYLVRDVAEEKQQAASMPDQLAGIDRNRSTNQYNRVFMALEIIMAAAQKDLFAYATSQNIPMSQLFDPKAGHLSRVTSSIHTALRKAEEESKVPAQEYLVNLIASMMALQNGYVEAEPAQYVPEEAIPSADAPTTFEPEPAGESVPEISKEAWDLSNTAPAEAPAPEVVPDVAPETTPEAVVPAEAPVTEPAEEPVVEAPAPATEETPAVAPVQEETPAAPVDEAPAAEEAPVIEAAPEVVEPATVESVVAEDVAPVADEAAPVTVEAPAEEPAPVDVPAAEPAAPVETVVPVTEPVEPAVEQVVPAEEPAPVIEPVVEQAETPAAPVEVVATPAADEAAVAAPSDDEPKKKKKRSKKKKIEEPAAVETPAETPAPEAPSAATPAPAAEDEIDYSKPLPVR